MKKIVLIGKNIDHSFSPFVHNFYYDKLNIKANYQLLNIHSKTKLKKIIEKIKSSNIDAANVTSPYKAEIISYLDYIDPVAESIGSVNCIKVSNGLLKGYNTDWIGFTKAIKNFQRFNNVVIFGNGGVVPAVIKSIDEQKKVKINIIARNSIDFKSNNCIHHNIDDFHLDGENHIIINSLPSNANINWSRLFKSIHGNVLYGIDLNYHKNVTKFLNSLSNNIEKENGLNMLIYQALKSIDLWFDKNLIITENITEIKDIIIRKFYKNKNYE